MKVKKPTAFLLIPIYLAFLGVVTFHIHEGQDLTNHLHCKLCEIDKLSLEKVLDSSLKIQSPACGTPQLDKAFPVMLDDPLQLSGTDPPRI